MDETRAKNTEFLRYFQLGVTVGMLFGTGYRSLGIKGYEMVLGWLGVHLPPSPEENP